MVSKLLNQLVDSGKIVKSDTRPVLYSLWKKVDDNEKNACKKTVFDSVIGADGSLHAGIEQCKSAVTYPGGLTILITGHRGVGICYSEYEYKVIKKLVNKNQV
ncbi:transcriptional regulator with AAA-type ATPase domain [Breznakia sp. PF5-3]|uniref:hypothetical protein n=1 Tax=unclassified Breznakia TaxID=2623764 RepID=UPI00240636AA|nr:MULTISPECIES: hypothetical protein [unclassified Breznakia]MDL2276113.1 hypothetical protein [Breznakia sp. OttesenSCG-928-G09]MDF9824440.1 transcriptional regulator with AAA-type ATPase domain [Breznakia sp. PM6-1]MDF9835169.1 transcriptional regulator with AAA-type ATPase domain [Breznakia sp. PF5-3]MDF9838306.1 transcriptional regulator with AAA-type ATPase domain [Breznakia sp. PFB2-8]MDF9860322.1 transcriptional regulator with AAA-type ATPase domain [Breznakia sp. PH5-24]